MAPVILKSKNSPNSSKTFHIVIPTYGGGPKLEVIINCFLSQTCQDFHLTIISDGPEIDTEKQLEKYYDLENFSYYHTDKRYNDFGHSPRESGLFLSNCDFTIMSGYDNYYTPIFIEMFKKASLGENVGFIFCDFLLDHPRDGVRYNGYIDSRLEVNYIDIGNFAVSTPIAKDVGFISREFAADWVFVDSAIPKLIENNKVFVKIPQTLYVHN